MKKAFVTGITGQDGSYLAEFLLAKGYEVHGLIRRSSSFNTCRIDALYEDPHVHGIRLFLHHGDVTDSTNLMKLLLHVRPDEIYHLAAQSHVRVSFDMPEYTTEVTATGTVRLLEAVRAAGLETRFYHASSSDLFGQAESEMQDENTPFRPCSPYGVAKLAAHWAVVNARQSRGLFACNGIAFNHESPRRGETFVSRKITRAVAHIRAGLQRDLYLGDLDAERDWGYAKDYVEAMWLMLQQDQADDYVLATGHTHSVREFLDIAFRHAGLRWQEYVKNDPRYHRPAEIARLAGDPTKARRHLGWESRTSFGELVRLMVDEDIALLERQNTKAVYVIC